MNSVSVTLSWYILFVMFLNSCRVMNSATRNDFSRCFEPLELNNQFFRSDGYYCLNIYSDSTKSEVQNKNYFYFARDGLVLVFSSEHQFYYVKDKADWDNKLIGTGIYNFDNNRISVRYLNIFPAASRCTNIWIIPKQDSTYYVDVRHLCKVNPEDVTWEIEYDTLHFFKSDTLPELDDLWYKDKKWFWCDEEKFKKWKKLKAAHNKEKNENSPSLFGESSLK